MTKRAKLGMFLSVVVGIAVAVSVTVAARLFRPSAVQGAEAYLKNPSAGKKECVDHGAYDAMLKKYVKNNRVDYRGLKAEEQKLQVYLDSLAKVDPKACSRDEILALFINAYNAATLKLVLEHYPLKSIKDIPSKDRWDAERWTVAGEPLSLTDIEHKVLRKRFDEPRIHFAVNCASTSCPPLRAEAYTGGKINEQLQAAAEYFNRDFGGARWDAASKTLTLSKIYDWYEGDFKRQGDLVSFVAKYAKPEMAKELDALGNKNVNVEHESYDWSLNDVRKL